MAEDIIEFRAWAREQRQTRKTWKEMEEENNSIWSKCEGFSWVNYYKGQEAPEEKEVCESVCATDAFEPSDMMEYLGLQESDFFYA